MNFEGEVVRVARTREALDGLLTAIERGGRARPDWIHLQSDARLDAWPLEQWPTLLARIHRCVLRGFRTADLPIEDPDDFLARWRTIARAGFHDFDSRGWSKCFDSPHVENYDYLATYLEGGLGALDAYAVYGSVLGSHECGLEELVESEKLRATRTVIEPMAGTAELAYQGHFRYPDFRYLMIDLDADARDRVLARPWNAETDHHYFVADVLEEEVWKQAKSQCSGPSLAFVGKQSHHLFDAHQLWKLLELGTLYADSLVLETPAMSLVSEMASEEELTRPEMAAAGLHVGLVDEPDTVPHPFTNQISFRLDAWDHTGRRTLFRYPRWTVWTQPTLVALADLLGLHAYYHHSELDEFVPVAHDASESDCHDNVTLMLFTRDAR